MYQYYGSATKCLGSTVVSSGLVVWMAAYISAATSIWMSWRGNYPDRIASPGAVGRGSQAGAVRSRRLSGSAGTDRCAAQGQAEPHHRADRGAYRAPFRLWVTDQPAVEAEDNATCRVVYFATHGMVAGDVKGLGEPSLAPTACGPARRPPVCRGRRRWAQHSSIPPTAPACLLTPTLQPMPT
jgi:hypothetical protein